MAWIALVIVLAIALVLAILFLNRFYRKASREVALVRTGFGGQRVVMDGGCLVLPFLHRVSEVNMRTNRLEVSRAGDRSVITEDRLRVDVDLEAYVRVEPTPGGVATAAQALAGKAFRASELSEMIEGKIVDALQAVAARYTMDSLHENRGGYAREVRELLQESLAPNGLTVESVSLTRLDQTPFQALDENNAFNAVGMRRLAEIIAANRKQRAAIEADADIAVRQSQLDAIKRKLILEREEREAEIAQRADLEKHRAETDAEIAEQREEASRRAEQARISREHDVRQTEIARDRTLRQLEIESRLNVEVRQIENAIALARKQQEEAAALAEAEKARTAQVLAHESLQTEKERAAAERARALANIRAREQAEVDATRTKSEVGTVLEKARAESEAREMRAQATRSEMLAESEGRAALIEAENSLAEPVIRMKVDLQRLETLPGLVGQMMKPVEKIDRIRINQVTGFGSTPGGGAEAGPRPLVNQAVDSILAMALQMPALRRLGEEIGIDVGAGLEGIGRAASGDDAGTGPESAKEDHERQDRGEEPR